MEIQRPDYLKMLTDTMHNGTVKIITGIRRCGKSFLLESIFRNYLLSIGVKPDHIITISLDQMEYERLQNPRELYDYIVKRLKRDDTHSYVFIDEIQLARKVKKLGVDESQTAPEDAESIWLTFYDVLNSLNSMPFVDVYVTGSNSRMLAKDIATDFRGRRTEIPMFPLSFAEFHAYKSGDKSDEWDEYMTFGGLPQVVLEENIQRKAAILKELFANVYLKDVIDRNKITDSERFESIVRTLSSSVGSLTNPPRIANTMRNLNNDAPSLPTIRKFIGYLTEAYLFRKADRYDVRGRRYLDFPSKYYIEDVGLRNSLLGFREQEDAHIMENILYNELIRRGYSVDVGVVELVHTADSKRETRQHEIDFVVNTGREKIYIQSTFAMVTPEQRTREELPLLKTGDSFRKIIVVNGFKSPWMDNNGIMNVGIVPFLIKPQILSGVIDQ